MKIDFLGAILEDCPKIRTISYKIQNMETQSLKNWILKDLKFTQNESEAEEICRYIGKGNLKQIWSFFAQRIRPKNEVEEIRGNLKLEEEKLENLETFQELQKNKKKIAQIDHEIKRIQILCLDSNKNKNDLNVRKMIKKQRKLTLFLIYFREN